MKKVAVVILNWNGINFLKEFIPFVTKYTDPGLADIVVADNGSTDDSVPWLKKKYQDITIIQLDKNYGFAQGYNLALEQLNHPYYLLLNSDVEVTRGWLNPLIEMMEYYPDIGATMPKIRSYHNRDFFEYAGAAGGFIDRFGYPFCRGRIFNHLEKDSGQYDGSIEIFWASGACLLIRSECYKLAGGLDPFFFAHMEEIDLCWRLKNMGYRIMFNHQSTVFHVGGGTLPKQDNQKTYLNFRNNLILLIKNLPANQLYRIIIIRIFLDMTAALFFLVKLEMGEFTAVFKAYISLLGNLKSIRKSRQKTGERIKPATQTEILNKSIVFNFYLKGIKEYSKLPKDMASVFRVP